MVSRFIHVQSINSYNNLRPCYKPCLLVEAIISGFMYLFPMRGTGSQGRRVELSPTKSPLLPPPPAPSFLENTKNKGKAVLEVL